MRWSKFIIFLDLYSVSACVLVFHLERALVTTRSVHDKMTSILSRETQNYPLYFLIINIINTCMNWLINYLIR